MIFGNKNFEASWFFSTEILQIQKIRSQNVALV